MRTLVKFPSRARPALFADTFKKWYADDSVRFLITLDKDDEHLSAYLRTLALYDQSRIKIRVGNSKSKIEAINDGVAEEDFGILILAADDMVPQRPDYARHIVEIFDHYFPNGDGVLRLNDGRRGDLNTLPIVDRKYFDRHGYIYHPAYASLWADNEFQEVSERLGCAKFVDEVIVKHEWIGDRPEADDLHVRNEMFFHDDMEIFKKREAAGFP